eukprot:scaffold21430_cov188-Skeletonema_marinoi.AAC.2
MSANEDLEEASNNMMMYCAACGIAGADDIKLKKCTACKSVRYCGVKCQKEHRPKHKKECKKRAAELRDEILFKQPESSDLGDCPICCIPLSIDAQKSILMACCCKMVCVGCNIANQKREVQESMENKCPFCRHPAPYNEKEVKINLMRRIEVNDPAAMRQMGQFCYYEGDHRGAFENFSKAAELGNAGRSPKTYIGMIPYLRGRPLIVIAPQTLQNETKQNKTQQNAQPCNEETRCNNPDGTPTS